MRTRMILVLLLSLLAVSCAMTQTQPVISSPEDNMSEGERLDLHARTLFHISRGYLALQEGDAGTAFAHFDRLEDLGVMIPELFQLKAMIFIQAGAIKRALNELDKALAVDPQNVDSLFLKAGIMAAQQKKEEAIELYKQVIAIDPDYEMAVLFLAGMYEENDQVDKARKLLESFTKKHTDAANSWYELGRIYIFTQKWEKAKTAFAASVKADPSNPKAWIGLGLAYEALKDRENAIAAYKQALDLNPSDRVLRQQLIQLYLRQNNPDAAMEQTNQLEILGGGMVETQVTRGIVLYHQGQTLPALAEFNLVLEREPENDQARYLASLCYARLNELEKAIENYRKIPSESAYYLDAQIAMSFALMRLNRGGDALVVLDLLAQRYPGEVEVLSTRGTILTEMGRFEQAEQTLLQARKIAPDDKAVQYALAVLYERSGNWRKAVKLMEQRLENNPNDVDALNFIGYTLADHNEELDRAEELLARAVRLRPTSGHIIDSYGWVLYRQKKYEQALANLQRAFELEPSEAVIAEHIGDVYEAMGKHDLAVEQWRKAITLNPDMPTRKRLEEKLGEH